MSQFHYDVETYNKETGFQYLTGLTFEEYQRLKSFESFTTVLVRYY